MSTTPLEEEELGRVAKSSPYVLAATRQFNQVNSLLTERIVSCRSPEKAARIMKFLIDVQAECLKQGNFEGAMAIKACFENASVGRLKRSWGKVDKKRMKMKEEMAEVLSRKGNFKIMKEAIGESDEKGLSTLPYLGVNLSELTFTHEGNKNVTKEGTINSGKARILHGVLKDISSKKEKMDKLPNRLHTNLGSVLAEQEVSEAAEDKLYRLSQELEPRKTSSG